MGGLVDDEILGAFAVTGEPEEIPAKLLERYGDVVDRVSFYAPYKSDPERWARVVEGFKGRELSRISVSPGQSQNKPVGDRSVSSRRTSASNAPSRSPKRWGEANDIERKPASTPSTSRTTSGRPGREPTQGTPKRVLAESAFPRTVRMCRAGNPVRHVARA